MENKKKPKTKKTAQEIRNDLFMKGLTDSDVMHREAMRKVAEKRRQEAGEESSDTKA